MEKNDNLRFIVTSQQFIVKTILELQTQIVLKR